MCIGGFHWNERYLNFVPSLNGLPHLLHLLSGLQGGSNHQRINRLELMKHVNLQIVIYSLQLPTSGCLWTDAERLTGLQRILEWSEEELKLLG